MSKAMTPDQFLAQLKKWNVPYIAMPGWRTHNRAGHGAWGEMHGIVNHHDASPKSWSEAQCNRLLSAGRSDLPGPLCNASPGRNGTLYLIGWGRANHAGSVRPEVLADFLADRHVTRPSSIQGETVDANAWAYGFEWQNNGLGEPYSDKQLQTGVLVNAAICDFHGWSHNAASQHKQITARKVDMSNIRGEDSDVWLRREVALALQLGPGNYSWPHKPKPQPLDPPTPAPTPTPTEAADMLLLYRTPKVSTAYEVSGASLIAVTKARADAVRAAGVKVEIVTVPDADALWKLPKVG